MRREDAKIFAVPLYCLNLLYCQAPAHDPLDLACSIWWRGSEPNARCGVRVRAATYCMQPEITNFSLLACCICLCFLSLVRQNARTTAASGFLDAHSCCVAFVHLLSDLEFCTAALRHSPPPLCPYCGLASCSGLLFLCKLLSTLNGGICCS